MSDTGLVKHDDGAEEKWYDLATTPFAGSYTATWTGIWASDQTGIIKWQRIGNAVIIVIEEVLATANTAAKMQLDTGSLLPDELHPSVAVQDDVSLRDNGVAKVGRAVINTFGNITIGIDPTNDNFTGSGNSGIYTVPLSWII